MNRKKGQLQEFACDDIGHGNTQRPNSFGELNKNFRLLDMKKIIKVTQ